VKYKPAFTFWGKGVTEPLCYFFTALEKPQNQAKNKDSHVVPVSVKSFADFEKSKGKEWKE